jgi:hypothetical protein
MNQCRVSRPGPVPPRGKAGGSYTARSSSRHLRAGRRLALAPGLAARYAGNQANLGTEADKHEQKADHSNAGGAGATCTRPIQVRGAVPASCEPQYRITKPSNASTATSVENDVFPRDLERFWRVLITDQKC